MTPANANGGTAHIERAEDRPETLRWSVSAVRLPKAAAPAGKGLSTFLTAVIRPRLPGRARNAPAEGQAGAAGFDAGQIRQERRERHVPTEKMEHHHVQKGT
jgi:hypothetical protein